MPKQDKKRRKHPKRKKKLRMLVIAAAVLAGLGSIVGLSAKYRTEQMQRSEMIAADFHFSVDYLEEDKTLLGGAETVYTVSDWNDGITLELYNYEQENPALISALPITYTVSLGSSQFQADPGTGTLAAENAGSAVVTIRPKEGIAVTDDTITVTINTTPYNEALTAKFKLAGELTPTIDVTNNGTHYTAKIDSNHYSGQIALEWDAALIPDATNDAVQNWTGQEGSFSAEPFHTYEIIFLNPTRKVLVTNQGIRLK